jgi:hypothetical protein
MSSQAGISSCRWCQLCVFGHHTEFLLPGQDLLARHVPAGVELALVLVRPLLRDVMRGVGGAGCPVDEERFVGGEGLLLAHPGDGPIGQILGEGVALLRCLFRFHRRGALIEAGIVLVGFTADETVEMLEPRAGGPLVERADRGDLPGRHFVALAELGGRISVEHQRFGDGRFVLRSDAAVTRRRGGDLGDAAHANRVVVATGQHCLAGG